MVYRDGTKWKYGLWMHLANRHNERGAIIVCSERKRPKRRFSLLSLDSVSSTRLRQPMRLSLYIGIYIYMYKTMKHLCCPGLWVMTNTQYFRDLNLRSATTIQIIFQIALLFFIFFPIFIMRGNFNLLAKYQSFS